MYSSSSSPLDAGAQKQRNVRVVFLVALALSVVGMLGFVVATHIPEPWERPGQMTRKSLFVNAVRNHMPSVFQDMSEKGVYGPYFEGDLRISASQKKAAYGNNRRVVVADDFEWNKGVAVGKDGLTSIAARKWTNGIMYYQFNANLPAALKTNMVWAMHHIECHVPGIFFRVRTNEANWVDIRLDPNANGYCWSNSIGMTRGRQEIGGKSCQRAVAVHEIMHALGFWHEQSRPDRNHFLNVNLNNLKEKRFESNFLVQQNINSRKYPFDYGSLMEYAHWAFAKPGTSTLTAKSGEALGQYNGMSGNDVMQSRAMYQPTNVYYIKSVLSGKVLDVAGGSLSAGANILQYSLHGGRNQQWIVPATNSWVNVKNINSGAYMDIAGASVNNGANLLQWPFHGGLNQQFKFVPLGGNTYRIVSRKSGKVIDVAGASRSNGANVLQWTWHGGNNQRWILQPVPPQRKIYFVSCVNSGKVLDVAGAGNAANVLQWSLHGGNNQRWRINDIGGGWTSVVSINSGKVLDVAYGHRTNGANLIQYTWHGGANQLFSFQRQAAGNYKIVSKNSMKVVDVAGASMKNGANVLQWGWHGGNNQRWNLIEVPAF